MSFHIMGKDIWAISCLSGVDPDAVTVTHLIIVSLRLRDEKKRWKVAEILVRRLIRF